MHVPSEVASIGAELRRLREAQGLRQDELALAAGVSTRTVHAVESGKQTARIDGVVRIAQALGQGLVVQPRQHAWVPPVLQSPAPAVPVIVRQPVTPFPIGLPLLSSAPDSEGPGGGDREVEG